MNNITNNEIGHILCPCCKTDISLPFKILEFYISLVKIKNIPTINIHRTFTLTENNKIFINEFCNDTLMLKPFISQIILTKPWYNARTEMVKMNLIKSEMLPEP